MSRKISITIGCLLFALLAVPVVAGAYSEWVHQFQYSWRGWDSAMKDGRILITAISSPGPATVLRAGDEIVAIQADETVKQKMRVPTTDFWRVPFGSQYQLTIRRDGQLSEFPLQTV